MVFGSLLSPCLSMSSSEASDLSLLMSYMTIPESILSAMAIFSCSQKRCYEFSLVNDETSTKLRADKFRCTKVQAHNLDLDSLIAGPV